MSTDRFAHRIIGSCASHPLTQYQSITKKRQHPEPFDFAQDELRRVRPERNAVEPKDSGAQSKGAVP